MTFLHLTPQYISFSCKLRWQHGDHAIVHVGKHLLTQRCWQRLDEAGWVKWCIITFTILISSQSRLLSSLLRQHLKTTPTILTKKKRLRQK